MDRRKALKRMGLSLGYIAATPLVLDILQSCTKESGIVWTPKFFSKEDAMVLQNLVDLILPTTSGSPGALEVNVPEFIDAYFNDAVSKNEQDNFKNGIQLITKNLGVGSDKISTKEYDVLLAKYLRANKKEIELFNSDNKESIIYDTLINLRNLSVWAFKTSQKIGKEVLAYDPIPGEYYGCVSLEETTGGKAWSL